MLKSFSESINEEISPENFQKHSPGLGKRKGKPGPRTIMQPPRDTIKGKGKISDVSPIIESSLGSKGPKYPPGVKNIRSFEQYLWTKGQEAQSQARVRGITNRVELRKIFNNAIDNILKETGITFNYQRGLKQREVLP